MRKLEPNKTRRFKPKPIKSCCDELHTTTTSLNLKMDYDEKDTILYFYYDMVTKHPIHNRKEAKYYINHIKTVVSRLDDLVQIEMDKIDNINKKIEECDVEINNEEKELQKDDEFNTLMKNRIECFENISKLSAEINMHEDQHVAINKVFVLF